MTVRSKVNIQHIAESFRKNIIFNVLIFCAISFRATVLKTKIYSADIFVRNDIKIIWSNLSDHMVYLRRLSGVGPCALSSISLSFIVCLGSSFVNFLNGHEYLPRRTVYSFLGWDFWCNLGFEKFSCSSEILFTFFSSQFDGILWQYS